jgi:xanthine/uracil permease
MVLGNGLAAGTIAAVLINIAFNHIGIARPAAAAKAGEIGDAGGNATISRA